MDNCRFSLEEHCFLIKGKKRAAIYDLLNGDVYSVDEHGADLLDKCESGLSLTTIFESQNGDVKTAAMNYLTKLAELRLGLLLQKNEEIKKITIEPPKPLDFIWLEVTTRCNLRCVHCYAASQPMSSIEENLQESDWIKVMEEARDIGCRKLQFIGGEPLLLGKQLFRLVAASRRLGYEIIEIYTNATMLIEDAVDFLAENQIAVAVSVYGKDRETHEKITRVHGSFDRTIKALQRLVAKNIRVRVGIVIMSTNENCAEEVVQFLKENVGIKNINMDIIRPIGRGQDNSLTPIRLCKECQLDQPLFPKCTLENFRWAKYGHNCFSKDICISADGRVFPCIMERDIILGNIFKTHLKDILENTKQIRGLSKDRIETCQDCEYRYCCFDCRPKAKNISLTGNLYAKPAECLHDPYNGEWGNKN